jgi:hypothetical protein
LASISVTATPRSARCSAVESPVKPPPMIATSAMASPSSGGVSGAGIAVAA